MRARRSELARRAAAALLSLGLVALLLLLLAGLGVLPTRPPPERDAPDTFVLSPDAAPAARERAAARGRAAADRPFAEPQAPPEPNPRPEPPPRAADPPIGPPDMILLDREQFAGSDIGRMARRGSPGADAGVGESVAAYGPGEGPGGRRLFNAEWVREPTDAELAGYLPPGGAPAGAFALIACRTVPGNAVEDCRSLGEEPRGSGLARAMRQAAWQFRVRPPRIGGRTLVGEWVRIRISFGEAK